MIKKLKNHKDFSKIPKSSLGLVLVILITLSFSSVGQDTVTFNPSSNYSFIQTEANRIQNAPSLSSFYERLYQVKKTKNQSANIVQIGDSHIQADFMSSRVRQLLQEEFGNAGRGLIFPGRVARTNEPQTIYTSSQAQWESKRIVFTEQPLPIGIGAMTIKTIQPNAKLSIRTNNLPTLNYSFNKLTLFFQKDSSSFNIAVKDSIGEDIAYIGSFSFEGYKNTSTVLLPFNANKIDLQCLTPLPKQSQLIVYGLNLENQKSGVLFHSIGGNGAKFRHYLVAKYFIEQTAALHPDLFIISLGTNEAIEYPFVDLAFTEQLNSFVSSLQKINPEAQFILTIPADFFKKRTRRNPGVEITRQKIIDYAEKNKLAYWDMYEVGGGKHSADKWKKSGLMQNDGVHFTKAGYELQGNLLYDALIKSYNEYVLYRHP